MQRVYLGVKRRVLDRRRPGGNWGADGGVERLVVRRGGLQLEGSLIAKGGMVV